MFAPRRPINHPQKRRESTMIRKSTNNAAPKRGSIADEKAERRFNARCITPLQALAEAVFLAAVLAFFVIA